MQLHWPSLQVKAANEVAAGEVETLWAEKQSKESSIQQLELELEQERSMADSLVAAMQVQQANSEKVFNES